MTEQYRVRQGDCLNSISEQHGLFWETVWNDPANKKLKKLRKDPNVLLPGDLLSIPDKRDNKEDCATESRHRFRKKGVPAKMKVQLVIEDEPLGNQPYSVIIDDQFWKEGTTDGEGFVDIPIPPSVRQGTISVGPEDNRISFSIDFGTLDPLDSEDGPLERLNNLGYEIAGDPKPAIESFQQDENLTVTGELDQATLERIENRFGQ